jgi:serine/threonine protein kinase/Flp pilus assembly protein TadD
MPTCSNCGFASVDEFRFCPKCGTKHLGEAPADPLIGRTLSGKYRVLDKIGEGSMGTVYRGEHIALRKAIALKVLRRDLEVGEGELRRFQREGIAAGQLTHPNVTQVFDFDREQDGLFFLAMEFVDGRNLADWLKLHGPLAPEVALQLQSQLLATLVEAHRHGVVHRDLKPENVMVIENPDGPPKLKVLDFGLSKLVDRAIDVSHRSLPGRVVGTPMYMAPEQWRGEETDSRADLYSATLILYEMLAGEPPFRGRDLTDFMLHATSQAPPSLRDSKVGVAISDELDAIVQKGLAKNRDERFQTAGEMLEALESVPLKVTPRKRRRRPKTRPAFLVAGVAVLVAALATAWFVFGRNARARAGEPLLSARPESELDADQRRYVEALVSARMLLHEGNLDAARTAVERALALPCADAEGYLVRGLVERQRGDPESALADFARAAKARPGYAPAEAWTGWIDFDRGKLDAANAHFEAASKVQSDAAEGLAGRAAILLARGEAAKAVELLDAAIGVHADRGIVQLWRGRAKLATGDFTGAAQACSRALQSNEITGGEASETLGDAYLGLGDSDGAKRQYGDALRFSPDANGVRRKLAALLLTEERYEEAMSALRPALQATPADPELSVLRGLIEQGRGDANAAIGAIEAGLAGGAAHKERLLALLANLELQRGKFERAAKYCEDSAALDDQRSGVFTTWGVARFRQRDFAGAAEKFESAVALEPANEFAHYCLGVIYRDYLGDPKRALEHFEAHQKNGGARPQVDDWIRKLRG